VKGPRFATVGLHAGTEIELSGGGDFQLKGTLGYQHALGDVAPLSALSFQNGAAFTLAGAPVAENAAVVDLGVAFEAGYATFDFSYNGQFGSGVSDSGVRVAFRVEF
jgi:outer membrane autotransporter protein